MSIVSMFHVSIGSLFLSLCCGGFGVVVVSCVDCVCCRLGCFFHMFGLDYVVICVVVFVVGSLV